LRKFENIELPTDHVELISQEMEIEIKVKNEMYIRFWDMSKILVDYLKTKKFLPTSYFTYINYFL
ncbi:hypothetical protein, partial [Aneurinibacillus aneurinilyticus]